MNQTISNLLAVVFFAITFVGIPVLLISGWLRWGMRTQPRSIFSVLSLLGFAIGTASVLLAVTAFVYGQRQGGFPFYDPLLLTVYRAGIFLSVIGIVVGIGGSWRSNLLRWHAPLLSAAMFVFWFFMALGE